MTAEEPSEKKIATVGLVTVGVMLVALIASLIFLNATGRNDAGIPTAEDEKACLESAFKIASIEDGEISIEDDSTFMLAAFEFFEPGETVECADTQMHVSLKSAHPEDVAALAYSARNVTKDGPRCTWTDSHGALHRDECAIMGLGANSEVKQLIVEKVREQLRYPDSWDGTLDPSAASDEAEIASVLIGDRPCTDCAPIEGAHDG